MSFCRSILDKAISRRNRESQSVLINDRTLSGLPPTTTHDLREISHGAVLIGPFEGSRWRGGCGESYGISMGASPSRGGLAAEQASVEKRRFVEVA